MSCLRSPILQRFMPHTHSLLSGSLLILAFLSLACSGDSLTAPASMGIIQVTTSTTGTEPDTDGYTIQVDDQAPVSIGPSASHQTGELAAGSHTVHLAGLAGNCAVAENPVSVSVTAGQTAPVSFQVTCSATTGSLEISSTTSGPAPDADGYTVTIDGVERGPLGAAGAVSIEGLTPEGHFVGLSGVAANCQVQGDNPRTVTVTAGASAIVAFEVICTEAPATAGTLRITTLTTGTDPDPNGYTIAVDGGSAQSIGVNATVGLTNVAGGDHTVQLGGLAPNCSVQGTNPRPVTVTAGGTTETSFAVTCSATTGTIRATVTTTGSQVDANGYIVKVDASNPGKRVDASGSVTFTAVPVGSHAVALSDIATNCTVAEGASKTTAVTTGATAQVAFAVTCSATAATWASIQLPQNFRATALWASSASYLFVAGSYTGTSSQAAILHYDGATWTEQFRGEGIDHLSAFGGTTPTSVFAVGGSGTVLQHQSGNWVDVGPQDENKNHRGYSAIWPSSGQIFAGGFFSAIPEYGLLDHYTGTAWVSSPGHEYGTYGLVSDLSGTSPTDVYALGETSPYSAEDPEDQYTDYLISRFDGSTWTTIRRNRLGDLYPDSYSLRGLWAIAPNDVIVVGWAGHIDRYNGTAWVPMTSPTTDHLADVWGNSATNVYAVGAAGTLRYDGTTWSIIDPRAASRVWGTPEEVFVLTQTAVLHAEH